MSLLGCYARIGDVDACWKQLLGNNYFVKWCPARIRTTDLLIKNKVFNSKKININYIVMKL